ARAGAGSHLHHLTTASPGARPVPPTRGLCRGPVYTNAVSRIAPLGAGFAQSVLWDERGRIGAGAQTLLIAPVRRGPAGGGDDACSRRADRRGSPGVESGRTRSSY